MFVSSHIACSLSAVLHSHAASFSITFSSRLTTRPIENVVVELNLGEGAHAIKCIASRESGGLGRGLSSLETGMSASSTASWAFDSRKKVRFLRVNFEFGAAFPIPLNFLRASFAGTLVRYPKRLCCPD